MSWIIHHHAVHSCKLFYLLGRALCSSMIGVLIAINLAVHHFMICFLRLLVCHELFCEFSFVSQRINHMLEVCFRYV